MKKILICCFLIFVLFYGLVFAAEIYDNLLVREINIVDANGNIMGIIGTDEQGAFIKLFNEKGEELRVVTETVEDEVLLSNRGDSLFVSLGEAEKIIKDNAVEKWQDDFSMINYEINRQLESFKWLIEQTEYLDIMEGAIERWGDDFSMVEYEYKRQVENYKKVFE